MKTSWLIAASLALTLLPNCRSQQADSVHAIAERVDRQYNSLRSLEADFVENYRGMGMERREDGVVWLKKPGRMRWQYTQPQSKLFIMDGAEAFFYVEGEPQARHAKLKQFDDLRSPLRYLLGKTKLEKEFDDLTLIPAPPDAGVGDVVLQGVPRAMAGRVTRVSLEINVRNEIVRLLIEENDGSETEFRFTHLLPNVKVEDGFFRFTPPPGVPLVESNEFTP